MSRPLTQNNSWTLIPQRGAYATEPDIIRGKSGDHWLAWTERATMADGSYEGVAVARFDDAELSAWPTTPAPVFRHQEPSVVCCWPTFARGDAIRTPTLFWVAWQRDQRQRAALMVRRLDASTGESITLREAHGITHPVAVAGEDGRVWVAYVRHQGDSYDVELIELSESGAVLKQRSVSSGGSLKLRPALALCPAGVLVAWERYGRGEVKIEAALVGEEEEPLWKTQWGPRGCFNQAPALSCAPDGTCWVAWNTDWREARAPDLARRVIIGKVTVSTGKLEDLRETPGVDLEAKGEDQSLEFPTLSADSDGIWLAARASHNTRVLRLNGEGWAPTLELGQVLWGCRGTRLRLATEGRGSALVSCHDRKGITVRSVSTAIERSSGVGEKRLSEGHQRFQVTKVNQSVTSARQKRRTASGLGKAYWGDIHFHSAHSDGVGTIGEAYLRCRDRYGFDFACLTEHDGFIGRRVTETVWRQMVNIAEHFNSPEEFATLIGIEYTGPRYPGPGHKCLYFDEPTAPLVCRRDGLEAPDALLARVKALGGIAIPHHVGWLGGDPEHHDEEVQPCWEVCSTHGQFEAHGDDVDAPPIGSREGLKADQGALRDHFIRRRLEAGQIFGFVGGSDGHGLLWHHGISRRRDSHRTGLTGTWLSHLDRAGVMGAIRARRTWCTSGAKIALGFRVDQAPMGSVLKKHTLKEKVKVTLSCWGTAPLSELAVIASTKQGTRAVYRSQGAVGTKQVQEVVMLSSEVVCGEGSFLYVRAVQSDGEVAWASPVFWRP